MKPKIPATISACISFVVLIGAINCDGAVITWTNTLGGNWSTAANWDSNSVPGSSDTAMITNSGTYQVTLDTTANIASLTLGGGTGQQTFSTSSNNLNISGASDVNTNGIFDLSGGNLNLNGIMTMSGQFNWTAGGLGTENVLLDVATKGVLVLAGVNGQDYHLGQPLTNAGTINLESGNLDLDWGSWGQLINGPGGVVNFMGDVSIDLAGGTPGLNNLGTVVKSAGIGVSSINCPFNNSGTLEIESGTVSLADGGTLNGSATVADGTQLDFPSGNYSGSGFNISIAPAGAVNTYGGNITLNLATPLSSFLITNGTVTLNGTVTNLTLAGGTVQGAFTVVGTMNWTGGTLGKGDVGAAIATNADLILAGTNGVDYSMGQYLTNSGTIFLESGNMQLNWQDWGVLVNLAGGVVNFTSDVSLDNLQNGPGFFNYGTVIKSSGTGVSSINSIFNNNGSVDVETGTLALTDGGMIFGTASVGAGAVLDFKSGAFTGPGFNVSEASGGQVEVTGGTATLAPTSPLGSLMITNGALTLSGTVSNVLFYGGNLEGNFTLEGTMIWTNGILGPGNFGADIAPTGVLILAASNTSDNIMGQYITNFGTILVESGNFDIDWCGAYYGVLYNLPGGLVDLASDVTILNSCGGNGFYNQGTLRKSGGTGVSGVNAQFDNTGTVDVETGSIIFSNSYSATGGTLEVGINGQANFGQIVFNTATAVLAGEFNAYLNGGFVPTNGSLFQVLTYPSYSGGFTNVTAAAPTIWQTNILSTNMTLTAISTITWSQPADIIYGTVLGASQLDAVAGVPGAYIYNPPSGTMLESGTGQVLTMTFTPTNTSYLRAALQTTVNVLKAALTITSGLTANSKVYDSTTTATIVSNNVVLSGIVPGDVVSIITNGYTANFASSNVGTSIPVNVGGLTLTGSSAYTNYVLAPPSPRANITRAPVTIASGLTGNNKVYNRATPATLSSNNVVLSGVFNGDTVTLNTNGYSANFVSVGVGNGIGVTVSALTLSGSSAGNYSLTQPSGLTANITQAPVTVSSGLTASNKIYDRTTPATLNSNNVILSGVFGGDTVTLNTNSYSANFTSSRVANGILVTVGGLTLGGASAGNYSLSQPTLSANITTATVTISSGLTANNKVYNRTTAAALSSNNVVLTGIVNGDTVTLNTNGYSANFASSGVANGISVSVSGLALAGASATNYSLTQPTLAANITAATVTITSGLTANSKYFDGTTTATLNSNNIVLSGVINGDTATLNTNGYSANFTSAGVGAGITVTVSGLTLAGANGGDYSVTQPTGLTASILAPSLTITIASPNVVISWPTNAAYFLLNKATNMVSPVAWSYVTNNEVVNGTNDTVTINASSGGDYYFTLIAP